MYQISNDEKYDIVCGPKNFNDSINYKEQTHFPAYFLNTNQIDESNERESLCSRAKKFKNNLEWNLINEIDQWDLLYYFFCPICNFNIIKSNIVIIKEKHYCNNCLRSSMNNYDDEIIIDLYAHKDDTFYNTLCPISNNEINYVHKNCDQIITMYLNIDLLSIIYNEYNNPKNNIKYVISFFLNTSIYPNYDDTFAGTVRKKSIFDGHRIEINSELSSFIIGNYLHKMILKKKVYLIEDVKDLLFNQKKTIKYLSEFHNYFPLGLKDIILSFLR